MLSKDALTNGVGEPFIPVVKVEPGTIVRFGIDDDMTCMVIANFPSTITTGEGTYEARHLVYYGCFCDAPDAYECNRVMTHDHRLTDTLSVVHPPCIVSFMSARTEQLVEQIRLTEETLLVAKRDGKQEVVTRFEADLQQLRTQLTAATQALTEGKQLLQD